MEYSGEKVDAKYNGEGIERNQRFSTRPAKDVKMITYSMLRETIT